MKGSEACTNVGDDTVLQEERIHVDYCRWRV